MSEPTIDVVALGHPLVDVLAHETDDVVAADIEARSEGIAVDIDIEHAGERDTAHNDCLSVTGADLNESPVIGNRQRDPRGCSCRERRNSNACIGRQAKAPGFALTATIDGGSTRQRET